jgi:hypothetical protein
LRSIARTIRNAAGRQTAFSNTRGTDGTDNFVGKGRFLSCVSEFKCLKYQTKTIGAIKIAIPTIAQIRFARFTQMSFHFVEKRKALFRRQTERRGRMRAWIAWLSTVRPHRDHESALRASAPRFCITPGCIDSIEKRA